MADKNEMDAIIDQVYKDLKEHGYVTKETTDELKRLEQAQADYNKKLALGGQARISDRDSNIPKRPEWKGWIGNALGHGDSEGRAVF